MTHQSASEFNRRLRALILEFQESNRVISPVEIVGNLECLKQEVILAAQGIELPGNDDEED